MWKRGFRRWGKDKQIDRFPVQPLLPEAALKRK
jgi:hypothetical protein